MPCTWQATYSRCSHIARQYGAVNKHATQHLARRPRQKFWSNPGATATGVPNSSSHLGINPKMAVPTRSRRCARRPSIRCSHSTAGYALASANRRRKPWTLSKGRVCGRLINGAFTIDPSLTASRAASFPSATGGRKRFAWLIQTTKREFWMKWILLVLSTAPDLLNEGLL